MPLEALHLIPYDDVLPDPGNYHRLTVVGLLTVIRARAPFPVVHSVFRVGLWARFLKRPRHPCPPNNQGSDLLPADLLKFGNNAANDLYTERSKGAGQEIHPARFPPS